LGLGFFAGCGLKRSEKVRKGLIGSKKFVDVIPFVVFVCLDAD